MCPFGARWLFDEAGYSHQTIGLTFGSLITTSCAIMPEKIRGTHDTYMHNREGVNVSVRVMGRNKVKPKSVGVTNL